MLTASESSLDKQEDRTEPGRVRESCGDLRYNPVRDCARAKFTRRHFDLRADGWLSVPMAGSPYPGSIAPPRASSAENSSATLCGLYGGSCRRSRAVPEYRDKLYLIEATLDQGLGDDFSNRKAIDRQRAFNHAFSLPSAVDNEFERV